MLARLFIDHPRSVGESYAEHMIAAGRFAGLLFAASVVCLIHALVPACFTKTGSRMVTRLHDIMVSNRIKAKNRTTKPNTEQTGFDFVI